MKTEHNRTSEPFDEGRALQELERLRDQIVRARAARKRVEDEFDAFVRGFRADRQPKPDVAVPVDPVVESDPVPSVSPQDAPAAVEFHAAVPDVPAAHTPAARFRTSGTAGLIVLGAVAIGVATLAVRARRAAPPVPTRAQAALAPQVMAPEVPKVTVPTKVTVPDAPGVNLELLTRRRVWVRVTIDGRRAFERELAADQRIPLHAERTILIRAGDAGAIALTRDGRTVGALGADGMVATREFTVAR